MSLNDKEWLIEVFENRSAFALRYRTKLFDEVSQFQNVQIFQTEFMGRALILDGCYMLTERDAAIYHEMLVHPAMSALPAPSHVLVIGGGDGGAVTQIVKYPKVRSVTLCEIDRMVVDACREFLPQIAAGLDDPRVQVLFEDGAAFVKAHAGEFDLILVDSTDPVGPAKTLFETSFYQSVKAALRDGGAAVFQTESPVFMSEVFLEAVGKLAGVFGDSRVYPYFATVPCYPGGLWSFTLCSDQVDPIKGPCSELSPALEQTLEYYTEEIRRAAFAAPAFVRRALSRQ
ncbi:MAG: polyamine aminopropyltransferase [Deltaproteobacteria bacterium]|nr:polyamine aminopropyltransferase [Deltaproteobacteria bacterium]